MFFRIIILCFMLMATASCTSINSGRNISEEITHRFSDAVKEKDSDKFKSLFLNESVSWLAIVSDNDLNAIYKDDPNHTKVNSHEIVPFSDWLSKTKESTEVIFSDCKSHGDADVRVVDCEYEFYLGGEKTNYGRECFILVRTESGWKISGIAFSATVSKKGDEPSRGANK